MVKNRLRIFLAFINDMKLRLIDRANSDVKVLLLSSLHADIVAMSSVATFFLLLRVVQNGVILSW